MEALYLGLVRALPRLEFLALDLKVQMDGVWLQDLAHHCPRLAVLACLRLNCVSLSRADGKSPPALAS